MENTAALFINIKQCFYQKIISNIRRLQTMALLINLIICILRMLYSMNYVSHITMSNIAFSQTKILYILILSCKA